MFAFLNEWIAFVHLTKYTYSVLKQVVCVVWHKAASTPRTVVQLYSPGCANAHFMRHWASPHGISIGSAVLAGHPPVQHTYTQTTLRVTCVQRPHLRVSFVQRSPIFYLSSNSFIPVLKPSFFPNHSDRSLPFLLPDWLHGFHGLFTDTSEHIRFFCFPVFLFSTFLVWFSAVD